MNSESPIKITASAETFLQQLLRQQDEPGLALKLLVHKPGTAAAECELTFTRLEDEASDNPVQQVGGFSLVIDEKSQPFLKQAVIDYIDERAGGSLLVTAPDIKGDAPADDADLDVRVRYVLESEINPSLASHGGMVTLVDVIDQTEIVLQFGGGCQGCSMVDQTLKHGVEKTLRQRCPEISRIHDATDHQSGTNPYFQ